MSFSLRGLMLVAILGPPLIAGTFQWLLELGRPRLKGCFGDDLGPVQRLVIHEEDESLLGLDTEAT